MKKKNMIIVSALSTLFIIDAQFGRIDLVSRIGGGTRVTVAIPYSPLEALSGIAASAKTDECWER